MNYTHPTIDEWNLLLWAIDRPVAKLARMHLTSEDNVRDILKKHGVTAARSNTMNVHEDQRIELTGDITIYWRWPATVLEYNLRVGKDQFERQVLLVSTDLEEQLSIYEALRGRSWALTKAVCMCAQHPREGLILGWDRISGKPTVTQTFSN